MCRAALDIRLFTIGRTSRKWNFGIVLFGLGSKPQHLLFLPWHTLSTTNGVGGRNRTHKMPSTHKRQAQRQRQGGLTHPGVNMSRGTHWRPPKTETDPLSDRPPALGCLPGWGLALVRASGSSRGKRLRRRGTATGGRAGPGSRELRAAGGKAAGGLGSKHSLRGVS